MSILSWFRTRPGRETPPRPSSYYEGSRQPSGSPRRHWTISDLSPDKELITDLTDLRSKSKDLVNNEAMAAAIIETMTANIVGRNGFRPQSIPLDTIPTDVSVVQKAAEWEWELFSRNPDMAGPSSLTDMLRLIVASRYESGECLLLVRRKRRKGYRHDLCLQIIDPARLGHGMMSFDERGGRKVTGGVEMDGDGNPVAYWIAPDHPSEGYMGENVRIPRLASDGTPNIIHYYRRERPAQTRGRPVLAPVLNLFRDLSKYREAKVVAERIAACVAGFITSPNPYDFIASVGLDVAEQYGIVPPSSEDYENRNIDLRPGVIHGLYPGEDARFLDPNRPGDTSNDFIEGLLKQICAALGLPVLVVLKDFSQVNYSSARAALLEARRIYQIEQSFLADRILTPLWRALFSECVRSGRIPAPGFPAYPEEYMRVRWVGDGWEWVDPVKEVTASDLAIQANLSTLAREAASRGEDWEAILEQRARENARMEELGLVAAPEYSEFEVEDEEFDDEGD